MTKTARCLLATLLAAAIAFTQVPRQSSAAEPFLALTGMLHTHTGYSDGHPGSSPSDAYSQTKNQGLSFGAVTEHSDGFALPITASEECLPTEGGTLVECALSDDPESSLTKWTSQARQAAEATTPQAFTALRGFEWSSDVHNHMNVYFSRNYATRDEVTIESFYKWLQIDPEFGGGSDGLATFNHPTEKGLIDGDPRHDFNDFAYVPELDNRIVGIEVFNRSRDYGPSYVEALDKGWHLGAIGAEDTHSTDWSTPTSSKTVLLATENSPAALRDALASRRTVALRTTNAIRPIIQAEGVPMGSRIYGVGAQVNVSITAPGASTVELVSNGGQVVAAGEGIKTVATDATRETWVFARVKDATGRPVAYSSPIWFTRSAAPEPPPQFTPRWVAGDLHVHTTWSHDVYGGTNDHNTDPEDAYTVGWTPAEQIQTAETRGLDFLALTDHNNFYSAYDPGAQSTQVDLIPATELSLAGHAQILNASKCPLVGGIDSCGSIPNKNDPDTIRALAESVRSQEGLVQINHPSDLGWSSAFGDGSGIPNCQSPRNCAAIVPDSVEVWNIGEWGHQPPAPAASDNDSSLRFWDTYLDAGYKVPATGGSDNHWRSVTPAAGVGQPTTWVYVEQPGVAGILEGIRKGRTTVGSQPPNYGGVPFVITADSDGDGTFEASIGDTVTPDAQLRISGGTKGVVYRILSDATGPDGIEIPVSPLGPVTIDLPTGTSKWVRVELRTPDLQEERRTHCDPLIAGPVEENPLYDARPTHCRNRLSLDALTSPIYITN